MLGHDTLDMWPYDTSAASLATRPQLFVQLRNIFLKEVNIIYIYTSDLFVALTHSATLTQEWLCPILRFKFFMVWSASVFSVLQSNQLNKKNQQTEIWNQSA